MSSERQTLIVVPVDGSESFSQRNIHINTSNPL
jgi:hypothetical protein